MTLPLIDYYWVKPASSSLTCFVKWSNEIGYGPGLGLHDDSSLYQNGPLPDKPHVFNTNWILTIHEGGRCVLYYPWFSSTSVTLVPVRVEKAMPVEAPAGSVLVFHGNVWHGAFPKTTPGLRLSINAYYCGQHYRAQEDFRGRIPDEVFDRQDNRFRQLLGYDDPWGFRDQRGPCLRQR